MLGWKYGKWLLVAAMAGVLLYPTAFFIWLYLHPGF